MADRKYEKKVVTIEFDFTKDGAGDSAELMNIGPGMDLAERMSVNVIGYMKSEEENAGVYFVEEVLAGRISNGDLMAYAIQGFQGPIREMEARMESLVARLAASRN